MGVESIGGAVSAPALSIGSSVGEMASGLSGGALVGSFNPAEFAPIVSVSAPVVESAPAPVETPIPSVFLRSFAEPVSIPVGMTMEDSGVLRHNVGVPTVTVEPGIWQAEKIQLEAVRAKLQLAAASRLSPQTRVIEQTAAISAPITETKTQIAEVEEQEVIEVVKEEEEESESSERENLRQIRLVVVEAEEVSRSREQKIGAAGKKAFIELQVEAKDKGVEVAGIDGRRVEKFIAIQEEDISPTRRGKGPDGSLEHTLRAVASRFFSSVDEVKKAAGTIVSSNRPAMWAKEGKILSEEEYAKVEKRHIFKIGRTKAQILVTIARKRVEDIKKIGKLPVSTSTLETKEEYGSGIEDINPELAQALKAM